MRRLTTIVALLGMLAVGGMAPTAAQVRSIDPNSAIDRDLAPGNSVRPADVPSATAPQYGDPVPVDPPSAPSSAPPSSTSSTATGATAPQPTPGTAAARERATEAATYKRSDVFTAAEGVFGKGAEGLGGILEKILKDQGEPTAYIAGREASGAFVVGLRYGSGTLSHRVEGDQPIYWTGPSLGFDAGGNASKVFVLAYNLYDTHDLFRRFPEGEGHLYLVGGFSATYLRRGNIVLIPVRLGVGVRAGVNVGYMKFSDKAKWQPF